MNATIYYFTGENSVDMTAEVKRWKDTFQKKHSSLSLTSVSALHDDESDVKSALVGSRAGSLFDDTNLVVLKNILSTNRYKDEIRNVIEKRGPHNYFLFVQDEKIEDRENEKRIKNLIKKKEAVQREFSIPSPTELPSWAIHYAKNKDVSLSIPLAREIVSRFPSFAETNKPKKENIWSLSKEIDMLIAFCYPKKEITEKAIRDITRGDSAFEIWALVRAVVGGKKNESVTLLKKHLDSIPHTKHEGELRMIFAILHTQIRKLLLVKKQRAASEEKALTDTMMWTPQHFSMLQRQAAHSTEDALLALQRKLVELFETAVTDPKNLAVKTVAMLLF